VRLRDVFAAATIKIRYEYDFGASWWHEITLERTTERNPGTTYPLCTGFSGDSPVEYWSEDDPQEPEPFDLAETNRHLAKLNSTDDERPLTAYNRGEGLIRNWASPSAWFAQFTRSSANVLLIGGVGGGDSNPREAGPRPATASHE
jgi:hypothetical protein